MSKIKAIWSFFFGFKGKISQKHYGIFLIFFIPLTFIYLTVAAYLSFLLELAMMSNDPNLQLLIGGLLALLVIMWITLKFSHVVRRIHDLDMKAKDSLLFKIIILVEVLCMILQFLEPSQAIKAIANFLPWIGTICMIGLAFIPAHQSNEKAQ